MGLILFLYYEESLVSSNLNSKLLCFIVSDPMYISFLVLGPLEHAGEDCWNRCKVDGITVDGKCKWCGTDGWCCRQGSVGNGCDGTFGGENGHICTLKPGKLSSLSIYLKSLLNEKIFFLIFSLAETANRAETLQCQDTTKKKLNGANLIFIL